MSITVYAQLVAVAHLRLKFAVGALRFALSPAIIVAGYADNLAAGAGDDI